VNTGFDTLKHLKPLLTRHATKIKSSAYTLYSNSLASRGEGVFLKTENWNVLIRFTLHKMAWLSLRRLMSTSFRPKVVLDRELREKINTAELKPRKHPGIMNQKVVRLPQTFLQAVDTIVSDKSKKDLVNRAAVLSNQLNFKRAPLEENDLEDIKTRAFEIATRKLYVDGTKLP
jgi:hypothetical protein